MRIRKRCECRPSYRKNRHPTTKRRHGKLFSMLLLCSVMTMSNPSLALSHHQKHPQSVSNSRRELLRNYLISGLSLVSSDRLLPSSSSVQASETRTSPDQRTNNQLPSALRDYTALAPLGKPVTSDNKTKGLSLEELATRLAHDLEYGATQQGGYFLTGDLSTDLFEDDCIFEDPTNRVSSLSRYQNALRILFDPTQSTVQLISPITIDSDNRILSCRVRSRGTLQLPWHPYIKAYETDIQYFVNSDGLIYKQSQLWSKSASTALLETFTPKIVDAPPTSSLEPSVNEPKEVTRLFEYINGRRANEYTTEERQEIDALIDRIASLQIPYSATYLPGKWRLAYLQPGPNGAGIDRRIPFFPEFGFNNNYQIFDAGSVTNIGEVLGPLAQVSVAGTLSEEDPTSNKSPKRFRAKIAGGQLCTGSSRNASMCLSLPMIRGEGLFDSIYIGDRIRIGQNLNGGGARVVQIRIN